MSADDSSSGGGGANSFAAQHPTPPRRALNVAPTDGSTKFNTIRIPLIPVACWRLEDPAFEFDSSFVLPTFRGEFVPDGQPSPPPSPGGTPLTNLRDLIGNNPGCLAALFGHCDPAGSDSLNKTLGDRRAIAVYALVTRQPDLWAYLYDTPQVGDTWDLHMVQIMLSVVQDASGAAYYSGPANGARDATTTDAVKRFQADSGLGSDGDPGSKTRKALYGAYMDWLCSPASTPSPSARFTMQPSDFLGGANAQPGDLPKMSLQSCGKFNPILLLTAADMGGEDTTDGASKKERNAKDAPNRRCIMYLFPKGTKVDTAMWPCPKVKESNSACHAQFWPDGDDRRKNGDTERKYEKTRDTMACRFYDRFARRSPCESGKPPAWAFAIPMGDCGWPDDATVSIVQGSTTVWSRPLSSGTVLSDYRYFEVAVRQGATPYAVVSFKGAVLGLFGESSLYDIATSGSDDIYITPRDKSVVHAYDGDKKT